ncbi:MAG TPA: hypothetical protein VGK73_38500 [Polyangiaceae bacterium]
MNAVLALAHAAAQRPTLTSAAEWQRLARAAVVEHDRVCAALAAAQKQIKAFGPKFQGMTELA